MVQVVRALALLGLLLVAISMDVPISCDSSEECGDVAKQSHTLLQIKNNAAMIKKDLAEDISEGSRFGWWGCGTVNNGGYHLGVWWPGHGKLDAKIDGKLGAGMSDCWSCLDNLQRVQGYKCENANCHDKQFWGVWLVSSNCYKTPSPTPAPPTQAPTTAATQCTSCNLQFKNVKSPLPSSSSFETYSDYTLTVPNACTPTQHIENYKLPHVPLNLLMKFKSPYSGKTARNVVSGGLFQLNLQANSTVTIEFQLVESSTKQPREVDEIVMSVLDLDTSGSVHQRVRAHGFKAVRHGDGVKRLKIEGGDSPYLFRGMNIGDHTNNPSNAVVLSPEQLNNTMTFAFVKKSSWEITFEVTEGSGGRNFLLGGASQLMSPLAHC